MGLFSKNTQGKASEQKNWYKDRYQYVLVQRNWLLFITLISLLAAMLSALGLYKLVPLKSVEPFVIQIDEKSGYTQVVKPYTAKEINANEAVKEYFIAKYIKAREGYDPATASDNYRNVVRLLSSKPIYYSFSREVDPRNPSSPINIYGNRITRTVEFKSTTFLDPSTVLVRFKITQKGGREGPKEYHYIARITFEFVEMELLQWERYINPLGFIVTKYTLDEEYLSQ